MKSEFLVGSLASATGQAAVYPLDRIRSVMAVSRKSQYKNMVIALQTIVNKEGIMALYRGFSPGKNLFVMLSRFRVVADLHFV